MSLVCPHVSFANPQAPLDAEVRASVETRIDRDHKSGGHSEPSGYLNIHHAMVKVCFVFGLWRSFCTNWREIMCFGIDTTQLQG